MSPFGLSANDRNWRYAAYFETRPARTSVPSGSLMANSYAKAGKRQASRERQAFTDTAVPSREVQPVARAR